MGSPNGQLESAIDALWRILPIYGIDPENSEDRLRIEDFFGLHPELKKAEEWAERAIARSE